MANLLVLAIPSYIHGAIAIPAVKHPNRVRKAETAAQVRRLSGKLAATGEKSPSCGNHEEKNRSDASLLNAAPSNSNSFVCTETRSRVEFP
jgi:hypothetical protein